MSAILTRQELLDALHCRRKRPPPAPALPPQLSDARTAVNRARLAAALGLGGALGCALTGALTVALGLFSTQVVVSLVFVAFGLLGALVARRVPANRVGWLMCAGSLAGVLLFLPLDYGYIAQVVEHGAWPLGGEALWFGTWSWTPLLGLFLPLTTVRFPDGFVPRGWTGVDRIAIAGTAAFGAYAAVASTDAVRGFLPISEAGAMRLAGARIDNPLAGSVPDGLLAALGIVGLALIVLAYVAAVASLIGRYRRAREEERLQLKWFAYAGSLVGIAIVYAAVAWTVLGAAFGDALLPLDFATFALPAAIGIAILRYRLFEIDVLINRTFVYGALTAILAGLYASAITLFQRLFQSVTGQRSDAAIVLATLVLATTFTPIKQRLERTAARRFARSPAGDPASDGKPRPELDERELDALADLLVERVASRMEPARTRPRLSRESADTGQGEEPAD